MVNDGVYCSSSPFVNSSVTYLFKKNSLRHFNCELRAMAFQFSRLSSTLLCQGILIALAICDGSLSKVPLVAIVLGA